MRIQPNPMKDYPWYLRPFFWRQRRKYGAVLETALLWARSPRIFLAVACLYGAIDRKSSPITPALRALITVRVSQINHCPFCVDLNTEILLRRGGPVSKVEVLDVWRGSDAFNARERIALDYAEAITRTDSAVTDGMIEELHNHFDDDGIVELTGLIAFQNLSSKFNNALDVAPQGFCHFSGSRPAASSPPRNLRT